MKIAITADLHLRTKKEHPERYHALDNILTQCIDLGIGELIIAGDLFDKDQPSFSDFEAICKKPAYKEINIKVIPGNHDSALSNQKIALQNLEVIDIPRVDALAEGWQIMFVPYQADALMGEVIQMLFPEIGSKKWCIVGHGDYIEGVKEINPYEPGIYMPLTRKDVEAFNPDRIFLGHIHQPSPGNRVQYAGSPCALDSSETGHRHFLVFDTQSNQIELPRVDTDRLYFRAALVVFPIANSLELLSDQIQDSIRDWDIRSGDEKKASIKVKVTGYSSDREALERFTRQAFKDFKNEPEIDIADVQFADDSDRDFIFEKCIHALQDNKDGIETQALQPEILSAILDLVYGG